MKNGINLFPKKSPSESSIKTQAKIRVYASVFGVVFFIIFLAIIFLQIDAKRKLAVKNQEKQTLLQFLLSHKNTEAKTIYFVNKKNQLKTFLKDDSEFLPYYNLLNDSLSHSEEKPAIQAMTIDKTKKTTFSVRFANYTSAYAFLKYLESDQFLKNFSELNLTSFSLADETNSEGYLLQFSGEFITLK